MGLEFARFHELAVVEKPKQQPKLHSEAPPDSNKQRKALAKAPRAEFDLPQE